MAFGKPNITPVTKGDVRELQNLVVQLTQRLAAIEAAIQFGNGQTLQQFLQPLVSAQNGTVIKKNNTLTTSPP